MKKLKIVTNCPRCKTEETIETEAAMIFYGRPCKNPTVKIQSHHLSGEDQVLWLTEALRGVFYELANEDEEADNGKRDETKGQGATGG